ncbi:MAG TPA: hypothetical protein VEI02_05250, partial [Planctomycetota bacterium]|nr:hypothetical protein [Planctomycetota bacterium]
MDRHAAQVLEYEAVRDALRRCCASDLSRRLVDVLAPSTDAERLRRSLAQVDQARLLLDTAERPPLRGLRDVGALIAAARAANRPLEPDELSAIAEFLRLAETLREWCEARAKVAPDLAELAGKTLDHAPLRARLDRCIEAPGAVRDDATPRLAELRRARLRLEQRLRELMDELTQSPRLRPFLQERTWSLRHGRCVLPVKLEQKGHVAGVVHDKSAAGSTVFIEPREAMEPANDLAEARVDEEREVARILVELTQETFRDEERLRRTQEVIAWSDFTFARAAFSREIDGMAPRIVDAPALRLRRARHPLLTLRSKADPAAPPP